MFFVASILLVKSPFSEVYQLMIVNNNQILSIIKVLLYINILQKILKLK